MLKSCKSFRIRVKTMIGKKMAAILSKFTVLCQSSDFDVYLFKSKLILFYNCVIYYYTRIFLILFLQPIVKHKVIILITDNLQYDIWYSYRIQTNRTQLYGFKHDNNYMVSGNYFFLEIVICLQTIKWFRVTNNIP